MASENMKQELRGNNGCADDKQSSSDFLDENVVLMASENMKQELRGNDGCADDKQSSSAFLHTNQYCAIQNGLRKIYSSLQDLVVKKEFKVHIQKDAYKIDNVEETINECNIDVMKTECPIVIAGETSSGKSSIINLILGEEILPAGIKACTSRVCRIKYGELCIISTKDEEIKVMLFKNLKEMAEQLKVLAKTKDKEIRYVDIYVPVPLLQGNVIIVDTPGCADREDKEQEYVAKKMMSYLPNALAFIFVVNVANAGGIQGDRLLRIISEIRGSMHRMVSFSPEDVIFLLNKCDTISHVDPEQQTTFFNETTESLHESWKEVDDSYIFRISAIKISQREAEYVQVFDLFQNALKEVIARNENKRIKFHLRFLISFLDECNRVLLTKMLNAEQSDSKNQTQLKEMSNALEEIEKTRKAELSNIQGRIDTLIEEASGKFHEYIHGNDFRQTILYKTDKFTRFSIGQELDKRIYCNTRAWQETNIGDIFQKTIMTDLRQKFVNIHISLQEIKDNLTGFKSPFDVNEKITLAIASGMISSGAVLIAGLPVEPSVTRETLFQIAGAAVLAGVATSVLVKFEAIYDFKTVRENAFKARINAFSKEEIKYNLKEGCAETIQTIIETFLGEGLKSEIDKMKENISTLENEHEFFVSEKETLSSLQTTVKQNIKDLKHIEEIGLNFE